MENSSSKLNFRANSFGPFVKTRKHNQGKSNSWKNVVVQLAYCQILRWWRCTWNTAQTLPWTTALLASRTPTKQLRLQDHPRRSSTRSSIPCPPHTTRCSWRWSPGLVTNSIILCCICTIKDHGKKVVFCVIGIFLLLFHPLIPKSQVGRSGVDRILFWCLRSGARTPATPLQKIPLLYPEA